MTVTVNCAACGQGFQMDVDEEGWKLEMVQNLVKTTVVCNRCADLHESKRRSDYFAKKQVAKGSNQPF